jgi:hypothetical protein
VVLNPAKPYLEAAGAVSKRIEGPSWDKAMRSFEQQVSRHNSYVNHCDALTVRSPPLAVICSVAGAGLFRHHRVIASCARWL